MTAPATPRTKFTDHFSPVSGAYADFRPTYPAALFDWLADVAPARGRVWDCACGSGQASLDLAARFVQVEAADASAAQLAGVVAHPGVHYRQAPAEDSGLDTASMDLVTVAQALHWFDLPRFYDEVRRVLKPGGVLAVWSYGVQRVEGEAVDALVQRFYRETVGPFWPPERAWVEQGYRGLDFPFEAIRAPTFAMTAHWSLPQLLGYFRSWSATGRYLAVQGKDPVDPLAEVLLPLWGDPQSLREINWPLAVRAGRVV